MGAAEEKKQSRNAVKLLDSVFALRPTLMFPLVTMVLAGRYHAELKYPISWDRWLMLMIALCSMFGLGYLLNQIKDCKSDQINGKLFLLSENLISRQHGLIEVVILALLIPVMLFAAGFQNLLIWVLLMIIVGGVLYNFTPLILQNSPLGGLTASISGGFLLLFFGASLNGEPGNLIWMPSYLFAFSSACILTCLLDVEGDRIAGKRTFAVVFGQRKTTLIALVGFMMTITWGVVIGDWLITIPAILSSPILFWSWFKSKIGYAVFANKLAILALSVGVGVIYPAYLLAIVLYFPLARWYYARRFRLVYPSFYGN